MNEDPSVGYNIQITNFPNSQKDLYNAIMMSEYITTQQNKHLQKRLNYHRLPPPHRNTHIFNITNNFANLPRKIPEYVRMTQWRLSYNGLATARRLTKVAERHHRIPHIYGQHTCFLCGLYSSEDSIQHIYSDNCPVFKTAALYIFSFFNIDISLEHLYSVSRLTHDLYNPHTLTIITTLNTHTWLLRTRNLQHRIEPNPDTQSLQLQTIALNAIKQLIPRYPRLN